jgi:ABC-2 type transport system ATP-binding protein
VDYAIVTEQLAKRFKRVDAVRDVSFRLPSGSMLGFIGPNGAGKTTTIKMLMNLVPPGAGRATLLGVVSRALDPRTRRISGCPSG